MACQDESSYVIIKGTCGREKEFQKFRGSKYLFYFHICCVACRLVILIMKGVSVKEIMGVIIHELESVKIESHPIYCLCMTGHIDMDIYIYVYLHVR